MKILRLVAFFLSLTFATTETSTGIKHHHKDHRGHKSHRGHKALHKGHHYRKHHSARNVTNASAVAKLLPVKVPAKAPAIAVKMASFVHRASNSTVAVKTGTDSKLVAEMKALELRLAKKKRRQAAVEKDGHIFVNGPLPTDFGLRFAQAVALATGVDASQVRLTKSTSVQDQPGVVSLHFSAPAQTVAAVQDQSSDPESKLANGNLQSFLVDKSKGSAVDAVSDSQEESKAPSRSAYAEAERPTPVERSGIDIDTSMPYGDLEPFGREDTAQELTEASIQESDAMVDQLERAEVAEEKRAVFRALTRLRGAAISSFDGVARSQTGNIDEYNQIHQWRKTHPLHHLADEESDVSKWAFPDNADFF